MFSVSRLSFWWYLVSVSMSFYLTSYLLGLISLIYFMVVSFPDLGFTLTDLFLMPIAFAFVSFTYFSPILLAVVCIKRWIGYHKIHHIVVYLCMMLYGYFLFYCTFQAAYLPRFIYFPSYHIYYFIFSSVLTIAFILILNFISNSLKCKIT